jgi:hypothetical protein
LSRRYLDGRAVPTSVSWSQRQGRRWGSCTLATGEIRLSARLRQMPDWVVDYVLVHELVHLLEADHSSEFWSLVERYPRTERARGFLEGASYGEDERDGDVDGEPDGYEKGSSFSPELD